MYIYILDRSSEKKIEDYINSQNNQMIMAQHTIEWRNALLEMETDEAHYIVVEKDQNIIAYMPLFKFHSKRGHILQSSPFSASYGGVITNAEDDEKHEIFKSIFQYIFSNQKLMKETILFTIVTSPFSKEIDLYKQYFQYDYKNDNFFQYLDLTSYEKNQNSKFRNNLKRNLQKAKTNRFNFSISNNVNDTEQWYDIIQSRFEEMRINSLLPIKYYYSLVKNLFPIGKGLFFHIFQANEMVASSLCFFSSKYEVDLFLRAVKTDYMKLQAGTFLDFHTIMYFKKNNFRFLNWQSLPEMNSSSFQYKKNWGCQTDYHYYLTKKMNGFNNFYPVSLNEIIKAYPYHYVMPYDELK